ncbi:putative oxidoreductase [Leptomonas pyrrhocoris]|uniref:Putative oxidoreductase n=1 Tax=Leptomonas pyrrhocoris TaxID=157538 RepID=A0A0N0DST7_LEPPY|nr:putative oxidoreductase [Leptomonas pyrrhocoris]KPA76491.1 putative oxidoreductase [Leptomonas pyrrhocoris]|eukprot:XP_015654930.1 putative oxidoreductase [Leptomonas pyrrhocoris]
MREGGLLSSVPCALTPFLFAVCFPPPPQTMSTAAHTFRRIVAHDLSVDFRAATSIVRADFPKELHPKAVLVRNKFVGINASDINFTAGIYQPDVRPPFGCGFEAVGEVVAVGSAVLDLKPGAAVATREYGAFAEHQAVARRHVKLIPSLAKEYLPLDLSATTASIALEHVLKPLKGERAVVTAAAGGTGQFAVQLLKHVYACSVVGTCSSEEKAAFLVDKLHCDGAVNYRKEGGQVAAALRRHYPRGAQIAYESVGGDLLESVTASLALRGRIVSLGCVSTYQDGSTEAVARRTPLPLQLLAHSASLSTFFLPHFAKYEVAHFERLCALHDKGVIHSFVDPTVFKGLEGVYDAIDWMFARKNCGKVVVEL